ncbi:uncharacterized protein C6orf47 homolog [Bombina bombina]|uniref:uncharacterized protein C6orf47 homolog n=1 Tax=Bombina bombina TaxID=8345 RepID=UPI00235A6357|nr:uncharacterized protein C6orf47 homolog [Bombina bombina]
MFFQRSFHWPSPPAIFSKILRSKSSSPSDPQNPPPKPKRWSLPHIPLPTLPSFQSVLHFSRKDEDTKYSPPPNINAQHFQICINLVHHIIDSCIRVCLWLFSPIFQVTLDVFGIQGALKLWIHGIGIFVATTYGMYLLLWLAQEYLLQLTSMYGVLQIFVLSVSLKSEREEMEKEKIEEDDDDDKRQEEENVEQERVHEEERWAGGSEDEDYDSEDGWETDGKEEDVV